MSIVDQPYLKLHCVPCLVEPRPLSSIYGGVGRDGVVNLLMASFSGALPLAKVSIAFSRSAIMGSLSRSFTTLRARMLFSACFETVFSTEYGSR